MIFFMLLEESVRLDGAEYLTFSQISILPHLKKGEAQKVMREFEKMAQPQEIHSDVVADRSRLRKLLQGKKVL